MTTNIKDKRKRSNDGTPLLLLPVVMVWRGLKATAGFLWRLLGDMLFGIWYIIKSIAGWGWQAAGQTMGWLWRNGWQMLGWVWQLPFRASKWGLSLFRIHVPAHLTAREAEIYLQIKRYYRRRRRFMLHMFAYAVGLLALGMRTSEVYQWGGSAYWRYELQEIVFLSVIWTMMFFYHYIWLRMQDSEAQALHHALSDERDREDERRSAYFAEWQVAAQLSDNDDDEADMHGYEEPARKRRL